MTLEHLKEEVQICYLDSQAFHDMASASFAISPSLTAHTPALTILPHFFSASSYLLPPSFYTCYALAYYLILNSSLQLRYLYMLKSIFSFKSQFKHLSISKPSLIAPLSGCQYLVLLLLEHLPQIIKQSMVPHYAINLIRLRIKFI